MLISSVEATAASRKQVTACLATPVVSKYDVSRTEQLVSKSIVFPSRSFTVTFPLEPQLFDGSQQLSVFPKVFVAGLDRRHTSKILNPSWTLRPSLWFQFTQHSLTHRAATFRSREAQLFCCLRHCDCFWLLCRNKVIHLFSWCHTPDSSS